MRDSESSVVRGREGWDENYDEISKFKEYLNRDKEKALAWAEEGAEFGWVMWNSDTKTQVLQHRIISLFRHVASSTLFDLRYLVQFWAVEEGQNRTNLCTAEQPFSVGNLNKGVSWYRKLCEDNVSVCVVAAGEEEDEQQQQQPIGRAYRNGYSESTPDLRLYSSEEFPMRDEAARSCLRGYLVLPLFEIYSNECCGVLEFLSGAAIGAYELSSLYQGMQAAGLRSTHTNFNRISECMNSMPDKYKQQPESEIREVLELVMATVPGLHLAQVWVPCKQCANSICMERACFINVDATKFNSCMNIDVDMFVYLQACEFHHLQVDPNHFNQNLCDLSISKNPLAHHATRARLSRCFAISLQRLSSSNGERYVLELCLRPNCREDDARTLHSISRVIETKLKTLESVQFPADSTELLVDMLERFSEEDFTKYTDTTTLHSYTSEDGVQGWIFCSAAKENDADPDSVLVRERIENFMKSIIAAEVGENWIVQFWSPKVVEGRCCLQALDQPFAVGCLAKGLASLRNKCIDLRYFVDEEAGEEELGPPGRAFRIGNHETTPDLSLYSNKEFHIKAHALSACLRQYCVLPAYNDEHRHKCIGVMELIGVPISRLKDVRNALLAATLCSTHIDFSPIFPERDKPAKVMDGREKALSEVWEALPQIGNIPQFHMAKVWVPNYEKCASVGTSEASWCMELALSTKDILIWEYMSKNQVHWIHVKPRKGIIGMVMESQSKSCFCRNLSEFSIGDQPLAHYQMKERLDACFAICLQSSHTGTRGDFPYVIEFFLYQSPNYLVSFLNSLIPIMKRHLRSFEYASGKQLAEEMVVEVIEFSRGDHTTSTTTTLELGQPQYPPLPFKFKSVAYAQQAEDKPMECFSDITQTEQSKSAAASHSKKTKRARGKTGSHLSLEKLEPHFEKKIKDAAQDLGVGVSTVKRACRKNGINRWPRNKKSASILETESGKGTNTEITDHPPAVEEEVMMKVTYKEDTIKFKLRLSLGVTKLFEEVANGLNLKNSTFKVKYLDEDNEEILLSRDVDFQYCPRIPTASGETCIKLLVQLIS